MTAILDTVKAFICGKPEPLGSTRTQEALTPMSIEERCTGLFWQRCEYWVNGTKHDGVSFSAGPYPSREVAERAYGEARRQLD